MAGIMTHTEMHLCSAVNILTHTPLALRDSGTLDWLNLYFYPCPDIL